MSNIYTRETSAAGGDRTGITNLNTPLSNAQIDENFIALNNEKYEAADASTTNDNNKLILRGSSGEFAAGAATLSSLALSTALPITSGGTGATSSSAARSSLGLAIGSNVQAYDADLSAIAALSSTGFAYRSGTNTWVAGHAFASADLQLRSLGIGTAASGTTGQIRASNTITSYYSDQRLKENVELIPDALEKLNTLRGVYFTGNEIAESYGYDRHTVQVGVIAQDVQKVLPQVVVPAPFDQMIYEGKELSRSGENYMTVQYEKLVPLLIEAVKELTARVNQLENK